MLLQATTGSAIYVLPENSFGGVPQAPQQRVGRPTHPALTVSLVRALHGVGGV